jgi:hypothetical protein
MPSLDDDPPLDGPEHFADAAQYLWLNLPELLSPGDIGRAAVALSRLADAGYIVSPAQHDRMCQSYADRLRACEEAADELVRRIHEGDNE